MARHCVEAGGRVGIITNDQAEGLVDTETLTRSRALIREVLEQKLKSVQSIAEFDAANVAQSFSEREAFAAALSVTRDRSGLCNM